MLFHGDSCNTMYGNPVKPPSFKHAGRRCFGRAAFEWQKAHSKWKKQGRSGNGQSSDGSMAYIDSIHFAKDRNSHLTILWVSMDVASYPLEIGSRSSIGSRFWQAPQGCASMDPQLGRWFTDTGVSQQNRLKSHQK